LNQFTTPLTDLANGQYTVTLATTVAGSYRVRVQVNGQDSYLSCSQRVAFTVTPAVPNGVGAVSWQCVCMSVCVFVCLCVCVCIYLCFSS